MRPIVRIARQALTAAGALILAAACLFMGCAYGKIRSSDVERDGIHVFVERNYPNLIAYYSGERERPGAVLMDLKDDDVRLVPGEWRPISGKEEFLELMERMDHVYYRKMRGPAGRSGPRLQRVLDRNDKLIGYFFSPVDHWPVRPRDSGYSVDTVTYLQVSEWSQGACAYSTDCFP